MYRAFHVQCYPQSIIYRCTYSIYMKKRSFSIPDDLDLALKRRAVDDGVRFSDVVIAAVRMYLQQPQKEKKK